MYRADLLLILTDVDGVYTNPPGTPGAERIPHLARVPSELRRQVAGSKPGANGLGGMASKLAAAVLANRAGIPTVVAGGRVPGVLTRTLAGENLGTFVGPRGPPSTPGPLQPPALP